MSHCILRIEKIKGCLTRLNKVRLHHDPKYRDKLQNRRHPEREQQNQFWENGGQSLYDIGKQLLQQHQEVSGRKARSDAVVFFEVLTTVSPEMEEELLKNQKEWFKKNKEWIKETFPHSHICQISIEYDESTLHIHWILSAEDKDGKLNAREIVGNKQNFLKYQETYENKMRELFPNIEKRKSKKITGRKHMSVQDYWKQEDARLEKEHFEKVKQSKEELARLDKLIKSKKIDVESLLEDEKPTRTFRGYIDDRGLLD